MLNTAPLTALRGLLLMALLGVTACSSVQVDTTEADRFAERGYQTYRWDREQIDASPKEMPAIAAAGPVFREEIDRQLADKGYRRVDEGAGFIVSLQFNRSFEDGALPRDASNIDPIPRMRINRGADQASIDNAYAMAGPREMNRILVQFSDAENQSPVWAAGVSKLVDDANITTADQVDTEALQRNARAALRRALRSLPDAP